MTRHERAAAIAETHAAGRPAPALVAAIVAAQDEAVADYIAEAEARRARPTEIRSPLLRRHAAPKRPTIR